MRVGEEPLQNSPPYPHANSRETTSRENSFVVKPFPTVSKIRIFLSGSTPHVIGLHHAVNKFVRCCKLIDLGPEISVAQRKAATVKGLGLSGDFKGADTQPAQVSWCR